MLWRVAEPRAVGLCAASVASFCRPISGEIHLNTLRHTPKDTEGAARHRQMLKDLIIDVGPATLSFSLSGSFTPFFKDCRTGVERVVIDLSVSLSALE